MAEIALSAGYSIVGSDAAASPTRTQLENRGVTISSDQSGNFLREQHATMPIDWFVYTSALPADHPELITARDLGVRVSKRDELLAELVSEKNLKLIAVAGTHGKTTTTAMIIWLARYFSIPISYSVGAPLSWAPSGHYQHGSEYFVYECDEYDKNFLAFNPFISIITTIEHDHIDTYPTKNDYFQAFSQFAKQSESVFTWKEYEDKLPTKNTTFIDEISPYLRLKGEHNRRNASLILSAIETFKLPTRYAADGLNKFPGASRRFEKLASNLYTDYGHTPSEIKATLAMARELSDKIVLVYQPHQNRRQHEVREQYTDEIFANADEVFWLPTYLSREDPSQKVLSSQELSSQLKKAEVDFADLDEELWEQINKRRENRKLVLCMGAGTIDDWVRSQLES